MRWLEETYDDLRAIWQYIADESASEDRATDALLKIEETARSLLPHFPLAGPAIDEDQTGRHRHLICYSYRIIYRVDDEVIVVAVIHGARLLPAAVLRRK